MMPTRELTLPPVTAALPAPIAAPPATARTGVLFGIAAYSFWGLVPVYFKAVAKVSTWEVLAHRVVWSVVFLLLLTALRHNWGTLHATLRQPRTLRTLLLSTLLIGGNWFGFIWAVGHDQVMQASLGYFINPLVNVLLGFIFLRERLRRWQTLSVVLAGLGVVYLTVTAGAFPFLGLGLAFSFGFYGLLRKLAPVDTLTGLTIETALLLPAAVAFLAWQIRAGHASFTAVSRELDLLLMAAGLVTAIPLLWFAAAARRLTLATLGFLQYLAPTGHLLLALYFGEPLRPAMLVAFGFIWAALALYTADTVLHARPRRGVEKCPQLE